MTIRKASFTFLALLLLLLAFLFVQRSSNAECESPLLLGYRRNHHRPEEIANRLISDLGGLPKTDMDVHEALELLEHGASLLIYPVQEWQILSSSAVNPMAATGNPFDSESLYNLNVTMQVTYADGYEAVLQWSSWSYGFVACPVIVSTGTGPPGYLEVVQ